MNILGDLNINTIIWKKDENNNYYCYINNCGIENGSKLVEYFSKINYGDAYDKIISTKENQIIKQMNCNILLQLLSENIILEIRVPITNGIQLLSTVSHKIRIPLTNILGILTLIDETKESKINKKNIDILKKSCYEMIEVVNDIIDIVNLSRGELRLNLDKADLNSILHQCYDIIIKEIKLKNLTLKIIIDKNVPNFVLVDITKLKQIIVNLLNNAIENTHIGGIIINVSIYNKNDNYNCPFDYTDTKPPFYNILFSIKDTGSGIDISSKNYLESLLGINKININNCYKYAGLGLIISKYISNLMKGNIWFRSELNIGSVFYFNIICDGIHLGTHSVKYM